MTLLNLFACALMCFCASKCAKTHVCMYTAPFNYTCVLGHICRQACVSFQCFCRFKCVVPPSAALLQAAHIWELREWGCRRLGWLPPGRFLRPFWEAPSRIPFWPHPGLLEVTRDCLSILWQTSVDRWGWRAEPSMAQSHHAPFLIHLCPV